MAKKKIDFNKSLKFILIVYAIIFLAGVAFAVIRGVDLDINFKGGTKISYSYSGEINEKDIEATVKESIKSSFTVSKSTALAGDTKTFEIALVDNDSISTESLEGLTKSLTEKFKDNEVELYNSNSVSPTIAGVFFAKCLVAVLIVAILVVLYVTWRFRTIGGFSAAITALCALVLDVLITFCVCVIFHLQIDSNYIAVVLTILGYSLNDTIVVYDRVRENKKLYPQMPLAELVNESVNQSLVRNIVTTITTLLAVITIIVISELYGLTSLRTFAIPMSFGLASGAITSLAVAAPLWVVWKNKKKA